MPKERPILFNGDMVRALLDGRKTQTRRIVKTCRERGMQGPVVRGKKGEVATISFAATAGLCPYGQPGDRLWVRETFRLFDASIECGCSESPCSCPSTGTPIYKASHDDGESKWKPSIFMPRKASRITLEIVSVRVERLHDISEADAMAEGIVGRKITSCRTGPKTVYGLDGDIDAFAVDAVQAYSHLWEQINGADSWKANPWVWVVEFKRVEASQ